MYSGKNLLLAGEMLKRAKAVFNISLVRVIFIFKKVLLAGKMLTIVSMHVLLAGEMLKIAKAVFNISPVGAFFLKCFWLGKC